MQFQHGVEGHDSKAQETVQKRDAKNQNPDHNPKDPNYLTTNTNCDTPEIVYLLSNVRAFFERLHRIFSNRASTCFDVLICVAFYVEDTELVVESHIFCHRTWEKLCHKRQDPRR